MAGAGGGGAGGKLADLFVEFSTAGIEAVEKGIAQVEEGLNKVRDATNEFSKEAKENMDKVGQALARIKPGDTLGTSMKKMIDVIKEGLAELGAAAKHALEALTMTFGLGQLALAGFAVAGIHASAMGEVLVFQLERLSRTIAGLFRPELQKVIDLVRRLTDYIQSLSDRQRENIARWLQAGLAVLTVSAILPRMTAGIQLLITGIRALTAVVMAGLASTGIGALLPLLGQLLPLFAGLVVGTEQGRSALAGLWKTLEPVVSAFRAVWDALSPVFELFAEIGAALLEALAPALQAIASVLELVANVIGGVLLVPLMALKVILEILKPILDVIAWIVKQLARAFHAMAEGVRAAVNAVRAFFGLKPLGAEEHKAPPKDRHALERRAAGLESLEQRHNRLVQAAIRGTAGRSVPEQQLDVLQRIEHNTAGTKEGVQRQRPAAVR